MEKIISASVLVLSITIFLSTATLTAAKSAEQEKFLAQQKSSQENKDEKSSLLNFASLPAWNISIRNSNITIRNAKVREPRKAFKGKNKKPQSSSHRLQQQAETEPRFQFTGQKRWRSDAELKDAREQTVDGGGKEGENVDGDSQVRQFKIGGFFDREGTVAETALKLAVERFNLANADPSASESGIGTKFTVHLDYLPRNSFLAGPKVCAVLAEEVVAIFGPQNPETASHVQSVCDAFEMPHIETKWDHEIRRENYLVNLAPYPLTLSRALDDLVEKLEWAEYLILYENQEGLYRLQDLIRNSILPDRKATLIQLPEGDDLKEFLRGLLMDQSGGKKVNPNSEDPDDSKKVVVDCDSKRIHSILKQTQQIGLLNSRVSFVFTSLDIQTVDLDDFKYSRAGIFAYRIIDPGRPEVMKAIKQWSQFSSMSSDQPKPNISLSKFQASGKNSTAEKADRENSKKYRGKREDEDDDEGRDPGERHESDEDSNNGKNEESTVAANEDSDEDLKWPEDFTVEVALVYDALELLASALRLVDEIQEISTGRLHCESENTWQQGYSVINYMKMIKIQGLTGWIQFNTTGFRSDVSFDVVQLKETGLEKMGSWDWKFVNKLNWLKSPKAVIIPPPAVEPDGRPSLKGKTLTVTTFMTAPLTMWRESEYPLEGNARYEGYVLDLLDKLSELLGFDYILKPVADGKYGSPNKKGEWNGMIREVMDGVADIAVADLTINKMRQGAVEFTMPFMSLGISILYVMPTVKPPSLLSFMQPMGVEVWLLVACALIGTSIVLHLSARVSPYEWIVPHPCIDDPDELENEFTLKNCFFFTLGTYLCQGADIAPKTASTRMIAGFWWLFTLIMVSSYTANLATFLIVQDLDQSIKSLEDLPKQTKAKYGCLGSGTTATFFRTSPFELHQQVWKNMVEMSKTDPEIFVPSNKHGVDRVYRDAGGFAFFMESTAIEYNTERNCKLSQVGGLLDNKGYGIALKKGSNYTQSFSSGILKMQEKGVLDELRRKWWKEERSDNVCADEPEGDGGGVQPLRLANVGGVFIILIIGCLIACVFSIFELIFSAKELAEESNESFWTELRNELRFIFSCQGTTKPVRKPKEPSPDVDEEHSGRSSKTSKGSKRSSSSSCSGEKQIEDDHEHEHCSKKSSLKKGFDPPKVQIESPSKTKAIERSISVSMATDPYVCDYDQSCPRYEDAVTLTSPTTITRRQINRDKDKEHFITGSLHIKYLDDK